MGAVHEVRYVRFSAELLDRLRRVCAYDDDTVSHAIRAAVVRYVEERERQMGVIHATAEARGGALPLPRRSRELV